MITNLNIKFNEWLTFIPTVDLRFPNKSRRVDLVTAQKYVCGVCISQANVGPHIHLSPTIMTIRHTASTASSKE